MVMSSQGCHFSVILYLFGYNYGTDVMVFMIANRTGGIIKKYNLLMEKMNTIFILIKIINKYNLLIWTRHINIKTAMSHF